MSDFLDRLNAILPGPPIPDTSEGHDDLAQRLLRLNFVERQSIIDDLDTHLPPDAGPREFGKHYRLKRKLKAAHESAKRVYR